MFSYRRCREREICEIQFSKTDLKGKWCHFCITGLQKQWLFSDKFPESSSLSAKNTAPLNSMDSKSRHKNHADLAVFPSYIMNSCCFGHVRYLVAYHAVYLDWENSNAKSSWRFTAVAPNQLYFQRSLTLSSYILKISWQ